jgi:hypothetical protein
VEEPRKRGRLRKKAEALLVEDGSDAEVARGTHT